METNRRRGRFPAQHAHRSAYPQIAERMKRYTVSDDEPGHDPRTFPPHQETREKTGKAYFIQP